MAKKAALFSLITLIIFTALFASGCFHQKASDKKSKEQILKEKLAKANKKISQLKKKAAESAGKSEEEAAATSTSNKTSRNFGYIKRVYTSAGKTYLTVDYAQMFTGTAADNAARADSEIGPGEHVDNDYYIRNRNPRLRTFATDPAVQIIAQTYNMSTTGQVGDRSISLATFKTIFQTKPSSNENMVVNPWWITLRGTKIIKIKEQYLP